jgi:hypothetical protein
VCWKRDDRIGNAYTTKGLGAVFSMGLPDEGNPLRTGPTCTFLNHHRRRSTMEKIVIYGKAG